MKFKDLIKKWWFWAIIAIVVIVGLGASQHKEEEVTSPTDSEKIFISEDGRPSSMKLAEVLDYNKTCVEYADNGLDCQNKVVIIKAKIDPPSNKGIRGVCFKSVGDYLRRLENLDFSELQFWAVADTISSKTGESTGENKVVSFTVPESAFEIIRDSNFDDEMMERYVKDFWILPSLDTK